MIAANLYKRGVVKIVSRNVATNVICYKTIESESLNASRLLFKTHAVSTYYDEIRSPFVTHAPIVYFNAEMYLFDTLSQKNEDRRNCFIAHETQMKERLSPFLLSSHLAFSLNSIVS